MRGLYAKNAYIQLLNRWNAQPFEPVANPFKIIQVDPTKIACVTGRGPNPGRFQWQDIGRIEGGDWDSSTESVPELPVVEMLHDRYVKKKDWSEIEFIQEVISLADHCVTRWRGCRNDEEVYAACNQVDELYARIEQQGYRPKAELVDAGEECPDKFVEGDRLNRYDEVAVDIGRDGRFLFVDGRHRLAIAQILDIESIPVRVSARHTQWQEIREKLQSPSNSNPPETLKQYESHPDVRSILNED